MNHNGWSSKHLNTIIGIDLFENEPSENIEHIPSRSLDKYEILIDLSTMDQYQILVHRQYDMFHFENRDLLDDELKNAYGLSRAETLFHPYLMLLNKPSNLTGTDKKMPASVFNAGRIIEGTNDNRSQSYDTLTDMNYSMANRILEIRIPYLLMNFKDPSKGEIIGDIWKDGLNSSIFIDNINISVFLLEDDSSNNSDDPSMITGFPGQTNIRYQLDYKMSWNKWEQPIYFERLKDSYYIVQNVFSFY
jgi:hypothetical protein